MSKKPRILLFDIETAPLEMFAWSIYGENHGMGMFKTDWSVLSWSAKWLGEKAIMYGDVSKQRNKRDDKTVLKGIWKLLDEADIVITQNGISFDSKKLNARFIINGMHPPAPYRHIDTKRLAKKTFGFTSNSLEYMSAALKLPFQKLKHKKFPGFTLWVECLKGNKEAWKEMKTYNERDVTSLEALYNRLIPWFNPIDMRVYSKAADICCPNCSSPSIQHRGFSVTNSGKFRRMQCQDCATWFTEKGAKNNLLSKEKRASLKGRIK